MFEAYAVPFFIVPSHNYVLISPLSTVFLYHIFRGCWCTTLRQSHTLCCVFLLPITRRISRLFHLGVTYVDITLLLQQPTRGISFLHTYELHPLNRHPLEAWGWKGDGAGLISHSKASSISQFIGFTKGDLFLWAVDTPLLPGWEEFH